MSDVLLKFVLLIVEFVLKGEEMFVKWDAVPQERLITASFVLLVDLAILQQLYLGLHEHYLPLHVQDVLFLEVLSDLVLILLMRPLLLLFVTSLEVRVALELLIPDRSMLVILTCIAWGEVATG